MKSGLLLLLLFASAVSHGALADEATNPLDEPVKRATALLAQRQDADSLAAAAALTYLRRSAEAEQLARRASAAAPRRPDLLWLHAQLCGNVEGCDRKPIDAKLRELDPENGATYLPALGNALQGPGPEDTDRLLDKAAASKRIDLYWNSLIAHLAGAVISTRALTSSQSVVTVIGIASVVGIPMFAGVGKACREEELLRKERRARCQGVTRALMKGDTVIAEMAGASLTRGLWPDDAPEARAAREARRIFDYRAAISGQESARLLTDESAVGHYLEKLARYKREQDVIVAQIVEAGRNPTPPADWQPAPPAGATPGPAIR